MLFEFTPETDYQVYADRRKKLVSLIKEKYKDIKQGVIVLFAGFEKDCVRFRQESSFYYYTGIVEPGVVLSIDLEGKDTLYIPQCSDSRAKWLLHAIEPTKEFTQRFKLNDIQYLGKTCPGYQFYPFFKKESYENLLNIFSELQSKQAKLLTLLPANEHQYVEQRLVLKHLEDFLPGLQNIFVDISLLVTDMRQTKSMEEIELISQAIETTKLAQEAAAQAIKDGVTECEVQASLEYIMTASCDQIAFPSIVATGRNSTVLHYSPQNTYLKNGQLVVVDIGAQHDYYCADLTRTYPVSGKFTPRQREVYEVVLATQQYIEDIAAPGYWINNKEKPEKSLHHLAKQFLKEHGYDQYFSHGIGHYLGLDVHDVGNYKEPLKEGDVFTIEPGVYIPEEEIGIRIEDDYWVVKNGVVCLSDGLPKSVPAIEKMVQMTFNDEMQLDDDLKSLDLVDFESEVEH